MNVNGLKWQKDDSWGGYFVTRVHEADPVNLEKAMVYSDNIYFAQAALKTGQRSIHCWVEEFGFEEESDYPFPLENQRLESWIVILLWLTPATVKDKFK